MKHKTISTADKIFAGIVLLALIAALTFFGMALSNAYHSLASGQTISASDNAGNNSGGTHATTTPAFLTASTASSTVTFMTTNASSGNLNLLAVASSSSTVYHYTVQYSYNGVDWYSQSAVTVASSLDTISPIPVMYTWTPGTTAASQLNVALPAIASKYTRIQYSTVTANGSLYIQGVLQNQIPN